MSFQYNPLFQGLTSNEHRNIINAWINGDLCPIEQVSIDTGLPIWLIRHYHVFRDQDFYDHNGYWPWECSNDALSCQIIDDHIS